jgi:hypothetical protein
VKSAENHRAALQVLRIRNDPANAVLKAREQAGLLTGGDWSLRRMLKSALDYIRHAELSGEMKLTLLPARWRASGAR